MDDLHLNTLYVTTEGAYLRRDGQTILVEIERRVAARIPIHMLDSIACFGNILVSPHLLELCNESGVAVSFLTTAGRMLARLDPFAIAWVRLRRAHYQRLDDAPFKLELVRSIVAGKIQNSRHNLLRSSRDATDPAAAETLRTAAQWLANSVDSAAAAQSVESLRGIEGDAARVYFQHFALMTPAAQGTLRFTTRSRRPPLDGVNALLSLFYSILTHDCAAALGAAGLDAAAGFLHEDRPGRPNLALDLVEEFRPIMVDRFVITLINRRQVNEDDFICRTGGAFELKDNRRKEIIAAYQQRKMELRQHPLLNQSVPFGRFPFLQARILAQYIRGTLPHYVPILFK